MTTSTSIPAVSRLRSFADSAAMARNPVPVLAKYNQTFGDTFKFYLGGLKEAIVTTHPAVIQHVLKTNAENYQKSEIQVKRMGHFLGKGTSGSRAAACAERWGHCCGVPVALTIRFRSPVASKVSDDARSPWSS